MKIRCKVLCHGWRDRLWEEGDIAEVKKGESYPSHFEPVKRQDDEDDEAESLVVSKNVKSKSDPISLKD